MHEGSDERSVPNIEETSFYLKRTGLRPTHTDVQEHFKIQGPVTSFGRLSKQCTYFIDSAVKKLLISRQHALIEQQSNSDGQTIYILHDRSLNGTYVNGCRVNERQVLKEGDIVVFGHTQGANIKPGEKANQEASEFQFVFQKYHYGDNSVTGSGNGNISTPEYVSDAGDGAMKKYNATATDSSTTKHKPEHSQKSPSKTDSQISVTVNVHVAGSPSSSCRLKVEQEQESGPDKSKKEIRVSSASDDRSNEKHSRRTSASENTRKKHQNLNEDTTKPIEDQKAKTQGKQNKTHFTDEEDSMDEHKDDLEEVGVTKKKDSASKTSAGSSRSPAKHNLKPPFRYKPKVPAGTADSGDHGVSGKKNEPKTRKHKTDHSDSKPSKRERKASTTEVEASSVADVADDGPCGAPSCQNPVGNVSWICCDGCNTWYHAVCMHVPEELLDDEHSKYFCQLETCRKKPSTTKKKTGRGRGHKHHRN